MKKYIAIIVTTFLLVLMIPGQAQAGAKLCGSNFHKQYVYKFANHRLVVYGHGYGHRRFCAVLYATHDMKGHPHHMRVKIRSAFDNPWADIDHGTFSRNAGPVWVKSHDQLLARPGHYIVDVRVSWRSKHGIKHSYNFNGIG